MSALRQRPLVGLAVGLSISESEDSRRRGFPSEQVNHVTVHVTRALLGQGATTVFGHDWREDGVMDAIHTVAREMQPVREDPASASKEGQPPIEPLLQNVLPWPDPFSLPEGVRKELECSLRIERAGLPKSLIEFEHLSPERARQESDYDYLRARALTHLRRRLEEQTTARICIGGRQQKSQGRYPGVIEEALLSLSARRPLFLVGMLGGATGRLIDAVKGEQFQPPWFEEASMAARYHTFPYKAESTGDIPEDLEVLHPRLVWDRFADRGVKGLSAANGLTPDENLELFETPAIDRAIRLILRGLSHLRQ
jgi:hypothetical protein